MYHCCSDTMIDICSKGSLLLLLIAHYVEAIEKLTAALSSALQPPHGFLVEEFYNTAFASSSSNKKKREYRVENVSDIQFQPWTSLRIQSSMVLPPEIEEQQTWIQFGVQSNIGYARLWIDHHLLVDSWFQNDPTLDKADDESRKVMGPYSVPIPQFTNSTSLLQLELTIHDDIPASPQLDVIFWNNLTKSTIDYSKWIIPQISTEERTYWDQREANEVGWNTWLTTDMLTHSLLPHGVSLSLNIGGLQQIGGPHCNLTEFPIKHGLKDLYGKYTEIEEIYVSNDDDSGGGVGYVKTNLSSSQTILQLESATFGNYGLVIRLRQSQSTSSVGADVPISIRYHLPNEYMPRFCDLSSSPEDKHVIAAVCPGMEKVYFQVLEDADDNSIQTERSNIHIDGNGVAVDHMLRSKISNDPLIVVVYSSSDAAQVPSDEKESSDIIDRARQQLLDEFNQSRDPEIRSGLVASIAWNKIYTPYEGIITPIVRGGIWGVAKPHQYVLFEWDTYLASIIAAHIGDIWVATSNIIRMTQSFVAMPGVRGFVPGFWNGQCGEIDKSKPPVGSLALDTVLKDYAPKQLWVANYLLPYFVSWNEWWKNSRMPIENVPLIAPGSNRTVYDHKHYTMCDDLNQPPKLASMCETGLDNSPLYSTSTFIESMSMIDQWDVGMSSFVIRDCQAIASLASKIGATALADKYQEMAEKRSIKLHRILWNNDIGVYVNRKWTDGKWVEPDSVTGSVPLAPTNFYPLLIGVPSDDQVIHMLNRFLTNSSEFGVNDSKEYGIPSVSRSSSAYHDNNYWRGRIWGPMNYFVYLGLQQYSHLPSVNEAMVVLANQSRSTFLTEWSSNHRVMENSNSETGQGCDVRNAQPFYHWGALTALLVELQFGHANHRLNQNVELETARAQVN